MPDPTPNQDLRSDSIDLIKTRTCQNKVDFYSKSMEAYTQDKKHHDWIPIFKSKTTEQASKVLHPQAYGLTFLLVLVKHTAADPSWFYRMEDDSSELETALDYSRMTKLNKTQLQNM